MAASRSKTPPARLSASRAESSMSKPRVSVTAAPTIKTKLMCRVADPPDSGTSKITIIGAGRVGMACAICILSKKISNEICLIDSNEEKVQGEVMDLQHGAHLLHNARITGGSDYSISSCSRMYIIAVGAAANVDESRLALLDKNAEIIKEIIPQISKISPRSIIVMVTNPVDILSYMAWKLSGFPKARVFGSGTTLDSARFRCLVSQRLNIAPSSCEACVIGEHGDSSVSVWSAVNVSGVNLRDLDGCIGVNDDGEGWNLMQGQVVGAANEIIKKKGYTNWGIALCCASIVEAVLNNTGAVMPVSTGVKGMYGIDKDVFLSMPCALSASGVSNVIKLNLTPYEVEQLVNSANVLADAQSCVKM